MFEKLTALMMSVALWFMFAFVFGLIARPVFETFMAGWGIWG